MFLQLQNMENDILDLCQDMQKLTLDNNEVQLDFKPIAKVMEHPLSKLKFTNLRSRAPNIPRQQANLRKTVSSLVITRPTPARREHRVNIIDRIAERKTSGYHKNNTCVRIPQQCEDEVVTESDECVVKDTRNINGYISMRTGHKGGRRYATIHHVSKLQGYNKRNPRQKQQGCHTRVKKNLGWRQELGD